MDFWIEGKFEYYRFCLKFDFWIFKFYLLILFIIKMYIKYYSVVNFVYKKKKKKIFVWDYIGICLVE